LDVAQVAFRKHATSDAETVEVLVDGKLLTELVREAESESAAQEGHPDLAGKYGGLPWTILSTRLWLGEATGIWSVLESEKDTQRVPLLLCECGEPGCWPLMATIEITADHVTWHDFRQPHRKNWDYSKLGPFSFEVTQYLAALDEARRATSKAG
jgi:hypothetical protein